MNTQALEVATPRAVETVEPAKAVETVETSVHAKARASEADINRVAHAFAKSDATIDKAFDAWNRSRRAQIEMLQGACKKLSAVSEEEFEQSWRTVLEVALASKYSTKASLSAAISNLKVAVIAFTNGIEPKDDNDTLTQFIRDARPQLRSMGKLTARQTGRPNDTVTVKKQPSARTEALRLLAIDAKDLDEETIRQRVAMLDALTKDWPLLIKVAAQFQASKAH